MWLAEKPSLRAASCCSVEVVNGGGGFFEKGLVSTEDDGEAAGLDHRLGRVGVAAVADRQPVDLLAVELDQPRR